MLNYKNITNVLVTTKTQEESIRIITMLVKKMESVLTTTTTAM